MNFPTTVEVYHRYAPRSHASIILTRMTKISFRQLSEDNFLSPTALSFGVLVLSESSLLLGRNRARVCDETVSRDAIPNGLNTLFRYEHYHFIQNGEMMFTSHNHYQACERKKSFDDFEILAGSHRGEVL